jgi:hypothetical protein
MVARAPQIQRVRYVARLDHDGNVVSYEIAYLNGNRASMTFHNDSAYFTMPEKDSVAHKVQSMRDGGPPGRYVVPLAEPSYGMHELLVVRAQAHAGSRVPFAWYYIGAFPDTGTVWARGDSAWIATPSDTIRLRVDAHGHILSSSDPGGTLQVEITRLAAWPDLDAVVARGPLGTLSPRAYVHATIGGAAVVIDYGRPTRRGRVIFGNVVPFNAVWRTGTNAATGFSTDHDLVLGSTTIPAGHYTLFSYITPKGWDLIVNKTVGEWGTDYDHRADLAKISMKVDRNASPPVDQFTIAVESDRIEMAWDTWKATLPVRAASTTTGQ